MDNWWRNAVGYQVYIKSFYDTNDDGIGDLNGIVQKLDYIKSLGVNFIWICPFYDSPMDDNGYDVRDYYKIDKMYGKMSDLKKLNKEAVSVHYDFFKFFFQLPSADRAVKNRFRPSLLS